MLNSELNTQLADSLMISTPEKSQMIPSVEDPEGFKKTVSGLGYSFSMTFLAELGDKTFLMILIYTARMNNVILFVSSSIALALMHTLGSLTGGLF